MEVLVQGNAGNPISLSSEIFQNELAQGRMHREVPASIDGGKNWMPAWQIDTRLRARGDDGLAFLVPMRTEAWSIVSGYLALFSLLFFGGPISIGVAFAGLDSDTKRLVRLAFVVGGTLLGPAPIALTAELGRRALLRDPSLRGKGRMIFALVVATMMAAPCLVGLVGVLIR